MRERLQRQRTIFFGAAIAAVVVAIVLMIVLWPSGTSEASEEPLGYLKKPGGGRAYRVTAWTLGDEASLKAAIEARAVDEIDFDWYHSQADGRLTAQDEDLSQVETARAAKLNVFATVTNSTVAGAAFSGDLAAAILETPQTRERHIERLVRLAVDKRYDGIDLDWEELRSEDRERFSLFVEELAAALHAEDKLLSIAVHAKTSEPGAWEAQKALDYERIGGAVDEFKIMTYAYHGPWSEPGPQAPIEWLDEVLTFAETVVPPEKIYMGVPFYGFSWRGGTARAMTAAEVADLPQRFLSQAARDPDSGELVLKFTDDFGVFHHAYVQDRAALEAKLAFLRERHPGIAGISIWVLGQEGPRFWQVIRNDLQTAPSPG